MKNTIRLTESDLTNLVKRVMNEAKYDLEGEDFSDIEKPQFGGGSRARMMMMRKMIRDIERKLDTIIEDELYTTKVYDTIIQVEKMLKDI